ncbi:MAG: 4-hydroxythreonine-4-phosphate dehydrogenase PdxA [Pseudomonadota bacterium]
MSKSNLPLAITMGDPSGIGPEIIVKSFAAGRAGVCIVLGSPSVLREAVSAIGLDLSVREIAGPQDAAPAAGVIEVVRTSQDHAHPIGQVSSASGQAAYDAIVAGIELAREQRVSGLVTAPIHKEALAAAGLAFPGHTEILASFSGASRVAMMLANEDIRTVLVTIHMSLRDAIDAADFAAQMDAIRLAHDACIDLGVPKPRVAVAGLNPHAGENGLFGREEIDIISPAIETARRDGIDVSGPWPGDTVFMAARTGKFDVVVAQYHDQGLIPVKYLGVEKGVNITLGLPFVRTSPDHGTAFDIAGTGVADATSLSTAIDYARRLVATRQKAEEVA